MVKKYKIEFVDLWLDVVFEVDEEKFRPVAQETLDFFTWDYDEDEDPVIEGVKKYAARVLDVGTEYNYNTKGVKDMFDRGIEGYASLDGKYGITLLSSEVIDYTELTVEVTEI